MAEDLEAYARKMNEFTIENEISEQYYILSKGNIEQSFIGVNPYYPIVTEKDYKKGEFDRYFVVRYNGAVTEISRKEASAKKAKLPKGLYYYTFIKWRIVESEIMPDEILNETNSIQNINAFYIKQGSARLPNSIRRSFQQHFTDLEQFKLEN